MYIENGCDKLLTTPLVTCIVAEDKLIYEATNHSNSTTVCVLGDTRGMSVRSHLDVL